MVTSRVTDSRCSTRRRLCGLLRGSGFGVGAVGSNGRNSRNRGACLIPSSRWSQPAQEQAPPSRGCGGTPRGRRCCSDRAVACLGNETIGDCTFASAADWAMITQGTRNVPDAQVIQEFHEAHGSDSEGLSTPELASSWSSHGIAGVHARMTEKPASQLKSIVRPGTAAIAVLAIPTGQRFAPVAYKQHGHTMTGQPFTVEEGGDHTLVVAGYDSTGPQVVTWGSTIQMTWAEWNEDQPRLYEVSCTGTCRSGGAVGRSASLQRAARWARWPRVV